MDQQPPKPHKRPSRVLEWTLATLIGLGSGFINLAGSTRDAFRKKLFESIRKTDVDALTKVKEEKEHIIAALDGDSTLAAETILRSKISDLENEITIKEELRKLHPQKEHAVLVDHQLHSLSNGDLQALIHKKEATEVLLKRVQDTPVNDLKTYLSREVKAADTRISIARKAAAHEKNLDKNVDDALVRSYDESLSKSTVGHEFRRTGKRLKNEFAEELSAFYRQIGTETEGAAGFFKGTMQKIEYMGKNSTPSIIMKAVIATGIGVAGPIMFFNSLNVHNKLNTVLGNQNDMKNER